MQAILLEAIAMVLLGECKHGNNSSPIHVREHRHRVPSAFHLRQRVGVHEAEQSLEVVRLHVVDAYDGASTTGGGRAVVDVLRILFQAEELRVEHRRPGREHVPVRRERLAVNLERHVGALPSGEEATEVMGQVRRWHRHRRGRGWLGDVSNILRLRWLDDREVTPDRETVVPEVLRSLKHGLLDEKPCPLIVVVVSEGKPRVTVHAHRLPGLVECWPLSVLETMAEADLTILRTSIRCVRVASRSSPDAASFALEPIIP
uniref:Uncharacterized protein n=1 Tax=Oryza rufipogon TaxID=4529 RepID=A0A0E0P9C8_ORYRU